MNTVSLLRPWLLFDLGAEMQVLSWTINRPGFVRADRIVWREVRNADLPAGLDVRDWFERTLRARDLEDAVAFLTSRDVSHLCEATVTVGAITAHCVATVGLSNAERIGSRADRSAQDWGTINVAVRLDCGLNQTGLIETLSIATQARTAAIIDTQIHTPGGIATGTGTDCIAVAAPEGVQEYAGLHTEIGEAVGAAVYRAVQSGALRWKSDIGAVHKGMTGHG